MCKKGNHVEMKVRVDINGGVIIFRQQPIDSCIAPLVKALNDAGIYTASCCCGHGEELGHIWLHDARVLVIMPSPATKGAVSAMVHFLDTNAAQEDQP